MQTSRWILPALCALGLIACEQDAARVVDDAAPADAGAPDASGRPCSSAACGQRPEDLTCPDGARVPATCERSAGCAWVFPGCPGEVCGGVTDRDCGPDAVCDQGACGGEGVCRPRPPTCPERDDPVCGCDGVQYDNPCFALAAGASVARAGPCEGPCQEVECGALPPIDEADLCPDGTPRGFVCGRSAAGLCGWTPMACPDDPCALPRDEGDCQGAFPRWFHNPETGACEAFTFGGCGGNTNNFETLEACEAWCAPDLTCPDGSRDALFLGGGTRFGECVGDCALRVRFEEPRVGMVAPCDEAVLEICESDRPGASCERRSGTLTRRGHDRLRALGAALLGVDLAPVYGCPDCADGGASTVTLLRAGVTSEHTYETSAPPPPLADADAFVQALITDLMACRRTTAVVPEPGCVPRPR